MNKASVIHQYLHYYFSSKTRYDIHSPFIYDFVCNVIKSKTNNKGITDIEHLRKELKKNNSEILVTDFGAGSVNNKNKTKTISDIAKHSLKSRKYALLLYRLVKHYKPSKVLELGTSLGISTCYMAKANPETKIITIEGCKNISEIAKDNANKLSLKNIEFITGNFDDILKTFVSQNKPEFIFFDGNHTEEATLKYFETALQFINNESVFIFDDINWSEGMKHAWDKIKNHTSVKVSIDLFFIGMVFFRKELSRESFVIRY
ncbi:MAG TPA: class I SAM-dependent methyltransferase [Bacteroidales bacterium]|nr:class I SAM-dependent methyltransferase [Bacteroidales bacterium]HPS17470.1 class I SAM-dependent methyltransferase [Bacteroidales bacterium]